MGCPGYRGALCSQLRIYVGDPMCQYCSRLLQLIPVAQTVLHQWLTLRPLGLLGFRWRALGAVDCTSRPHKFKLARRRESHRHPCIGIHAFGRIRTWDFRSQSGVRPPKYAAMALTAVSSRVLCLACSVCTRGRGGHNGSARRIHLYSLSSRSQSNAFPRGSPCNPFLSWTSSERFCCCAAFLRTGHESRHFYPAWGAAG